MAKKKFERTEPPGVGGNRTAVTISPGASAVVYQPVKKSRAAMRRRPPAPATSTSASAQSSAGG